MAVPSSAFQSRSSGAAAERDSFHGGICGRSGTRTAGHAGYEAADPVCSVLSGTAIPGWRAPGFCEAWSDTFEAPDMENFPGLALAYQAGTIGGTMPTVFNAANEWAVARFLDRKLGFLEITELIQAAMEQHTVTENPTVEQILETEQSVYEFLNHSGK